MLCTAEIFIYILIGVFFFTLFYLIFSTKTNKNLLKLLFIIELLSLNFSVFILFIDYYNSWSLFPNFTSNGQLLVLFILTISALEASIGLAFIYVYFRFWRDINISNLNKLKS
jgi:NADH:ubiquinone oxidoreductase subunit K